MKKIFLIIFAVICGIAAIFTCRADEQKTRCIEIQIKQGPVKGAPRSISIIPVTCFYNSGTLSLTFIDEIGSVTVIVFNQSTGEQWIDYIDADDGYATMQISEDEGDYAIEIVTDTGICYSGYFTL
ncbi:MAG: DUF3244 domain-containing protein [Alistipes senegalensis]|nr:DUF3244 domain-containing protein [Alistipes senegalensis]